MKKRKILLCLFVLCAILILAIVVYGYTTYTSVVSIGYGTGTETDTFQTAAEKENNDVWWSLDYEARMIIQTTAETDVIFSVYPSNDPGNPDIYKRSQRLGSVYWNHFSYGSENAHLKSTNTNYTTKLHIPYSYLYVYRNAIGTVSNIWIEE